MNKGKRIFEVHAFTNGLSFREFPSKAIADSTLFSELIHCRFDILQNGRPIFCTAVRPDPIRQIELNPHDNRNGTVHIAALDEIGHIVCGLSVAVDTGDIDAGVPVGLPLENKWKTGDYPVGSSLDQFRSSYIRKNDGINRNIAPWEMAELYRHFKVTSSQGEVLPRLAIYAGLYHLLIRTALARNCQVTRLWVFDAIPDYFRLYQMAGAALREPTIYEHPEWVGIKADKAYPSLLRPVDVPIPEKGDNGKISFHRKPIGFLDGIVDLGRWAHAVKYTPWTLRLLSAQNISFADQIRLRISGSFFVKRLFDDIHNDQVLNIFNRLMLKMIADRWDFPEFPVS